MKDERESKACRVLTRSINQGDTSCPRLCHAAMPSPSDNLSAAYWQLHRIAGIPPQVTSWRARLAGESTSIL